MSGLGEMLHGFWARLGMSPYRDASQQATDDTLEDFDERLTTVEQKQVEIKARLRILEKTGNPWGIGNDSG